MKPGYVPSVAASHFRLKSMGSNPESLDLEWTTPFCAHVRAPRSTVTTLTESPDVALLCSVGNAKRSRHSRSGSG